jgi:hypothetical protein
MSLSLSEMAEEVRQEIVSNMSINELKELRKSDYKLKNTCDVEIMKRARAKNFKESLPIGQIMHMLQADVIFEFNSDERECLYRYNQMYSNQYFWCTSRGSAFYDNMYIHIARVAKSLERTFGIDAADEYIAGYMTTTPEELPIGSAIINFRCKLLNLFSPQYRIISKGIINNDNVFGSRIVIGLNKAYKIKPDDWRFDAVSSYHRDSKKIGKILKNIDTIGDYFNSPEFTQTYLGYEAVGIRRECLEILGNMSLFYPDSLIPSDFNTREKIVLRDCDKQQFAAINKLYTDLIVGINRDVNSILSHPDYQSYRQCIYDNIADRTETNFKNTMNEFYLAGNIAPRFFNIVIDYENNKSVSELFSSANIDITSAVILKAYRNLPADSHTFVSADSNAFTSLFSK